MSPPTHVEKMACLKLAAFLSHSTRFTGRRCYANKTLEFEVQHKPNKKPTIPVVLEEDVHNFGVKGDLVRVKKGFARNYLIPKGKAVYAVTKMPSYMFSVQSTMFQKKKRTTLPATPTEIVRFLKDKSVTIDTPPCNIYECHIAKALRVQFNLHVPLDCIDMPEPITTAGQACVTLNLGVTHNIDDGHDEEHTITLPVNVTFREGEVDTTPGGTQEDNQDDPSDEVVLEQAA